jgi:hypothetical protein
MNSLTLKAAAAIALSSAAVVTGCGGDGGPKSYDDQVRETVTGYFAHVGNAEYSDACDELASTTQRVVADYAKKQLPGAKANAAECAEVFKKVFKHTSKSKLAKLKKVKVASVTFTGNGNNATAKIKDAALKLRLENIEGKWKISSLNFKD